MSVRTRATVAYVLALTLMATGLLLVVVNR